MGIKIVMLQTSVSSSRRASAPPPSPLGRRPELLFMYECRYRRVQELLVALPDDRGLVDCFYPLGSTTIRMWITVRHGLLGLELV